MCRAITVIERIITLLEEIFLGGMLVACKVGSRSLPIIDGSLPHALLRWRLLLVVEYGDCLLRDQTTSGLGHAFGQSCYQNKEDRKGQSNGRRFNDKEECRRCKLDSGEHV